MLSPLCSCVWTTWNCYFQLYNGQVTRAVSLPEALRIFVNLSAKGSIFLFQFDFLAMKFSHLSWNIGPGVVYVSADK